MESTLPMQSEMVTVRVLPGCTISDGERLHQAGAIVTLSQDMADLLASEQGVKRL
jgi:hypothetical protein